MATRQSVASDVDVISIPYHSLRHISSPEDNDQERRVYAGHLPVREIIDLPTDENVRRYLVDAEGKKRRARTAVHRAIADTLENNPENFSVLNGGIVLVARDLEVDEKRRVLKLLKPSIVNGAQTQGVIRDLFREYEKRGIEPPNVHIKFEAIITEEDALIHEISIARNFQNDVENISIAGAKQQLSELAAAVEAAFSGRRLRTSETDLADDYIDTEHLLQVTTLLIPPVLWFKEGEGNNPNKVYAYSRKSQCLKEFCQLYEAVRGDDGAKGKDVAQWLKKVTPEQREDLYQFYLDVAPAAFKLHAEWKRNQGFKGTRIAAIRRDNGKIELVPDGILFPILAAMSAFVVRGKDGKWIVHRPNQLKDDELIQAAKEAYQEVANSNPAIMGRTKACYSQLFRVTSIYAKLSDR